MMQIRPLTLSVVKNSKFYYSKMTNNHHVKNQKSLSWQCLTDCHEIWYGDPDLYSLSLLVLALPIIFFKIHAGSTGSPGEFRRKGCKTAAYSGRSSFWELTYRSDPLADFRVWWLRVRRRGLTQGHPFWGFRWYFTSFRGSNRPKTYNFWGCE